MTDIKSFGSTNSHVTKSVNEILDFVRVNIIHEQIGGTIEIGYSVKDLCKKININQAIDKNLQNVDVISERILKFVVKQDGTYLYQIDIPVVGRVSDGLSDSKLMTDLMTSFHKPLFVYTGDDGKLEVSSVPLLDNLMGYKVSDDGIESSTIRIDLRSISFLNLSDILSHHSSVVEISVDDYDKYYKVKDVH